MDKKIIKNNIFDYLQTKNLDNYSEKERVRIKKLSKIRLFIIYSLKIQVIIRERKSTYKKFIKNKIFDYLRTKN